MAGTNIASPASMGFGTGGLSTPSTASIDQTFANIANMFSPNPPSGGLPASGVTPGGGGQFFGQTLTGNNNGPFGVAPMQPGNPNNVANYAQLSNLLGGVVGPLLATGGGLVNTGVGGAGAGMNMLAGSYGMLQPSADYLAGVVQNPLASTAPTMNAMAPVIANAMSTAGQGGPRGGYSAETVASLPNTAFAPMENTALQNQMAAANALTGTATAAGNIGGAAGNLGLGVGGLGSTLIGQAGQIGQNVTADSLQKMLANYQYGAPQTFNTIMQGIGALLGGGGSLATGIGNATGANAPTTVYNLGG